MSPCFEVDRRGGNPDYLGANQASCR
jgi:hypothetical protein